MGIESDTMKHKQKRGSFPLSTDQHGLTLVELLLALGILGTVVAGVTQLIQSAGEDAKLSVTALHTKTVGDAAAQYIRDNHAAVLAASSATMPALIRVSDLISAGNLPAGYASTNPAGQATCVLVLEVAAGRLSGLVITEGGNALDDLSLGQVAATIGGAGGGLYSTAPTTARGAMGNYNFAVGAFGNPNHLGQRCDGTAGNITVAAGHPVMALWFEDGAAQAATLYRDPVSGVPTLNTMNTLILMGAATIQTAGALCTPNGAIGRDANGAVLACESAVWKKGGSAFWEDPVATAGSLPACNAASVNQTRVVQTPSIGAGSRAFTCNGAGSWLPLGVDDTGNITVPGTATVGGLMLGTINVENTACPVNGRISRNAAGATLECDSGGWRRGVKASGDTMVGTLNVNNDTWGLVMRTAAGGDNAVSQSAVSSAYVNDVYLRSIGQWASSLGAGDLAANMYMAYAYGGYNWYNYPGCAAGYTATFKSRDSGWDNPSQGGSSAVVWKTLCVRGVGTVAPGL